MHNVGLNQANVAHVFYLKHLDTGKVLEVVYVEQVCSRGNWNRNRIQCQSYLNSKFKASPLFYEHAGTGDLTDMKLLEKTLEQSYLQPA